MIRRLIRALRPDSLANAKDKLELSARSAAIITSELQYNRQMLAFYRMQSAYMSPYVDWWGFADAMEKKKAYEAECALLEKKVLAAQAKVRAAYTRYDSIRNAKVK